MKWFKDKKQRVALIVGASLYLCGIPFALLFQNDDGTAHPFWTHLGILMGMLGGAVIGFAIFLPFFNRNQAPPGPDDNHLKKKAWKGFWANCAITVGGLLMFGFLTYANIQGMMGVRYLIIGLIYAGVCIGLIVFYNRQSSVTSVFDERQLCLISKADSIANHFFTAYVFLALVIAFYLVGGRGNVPMWSIPIVLYAGIFLSGTLQFSILMRYAKEDDKNTEGEVA